ncbi:lipopolysaccharide biosynthesis protein [Lactococcus lactis]|uniref:lipopolysaccharide biosynthesis protein n=1 Tax=Lactococcus lactis TaxID=1358 RepID=UPI00325C41E8
MSKNKPSIFSGFFWKFNEQITSQLVSFIVSIALARILAPKEYGVVALVNVFIVLMEVFVTTGFSSALIQKKNATRLDFSTLFYCSFIFSIILYIIIFLCSGLIAKFYHNEDLIPVIKILSLRLPISAFSSIQMAYVSRHMAFKKIFFSTTIATVISGVLGISLAYMNFGVWALVWQGLTSILFQTIVLFFEISWRPYCEFSMSEAKILMNYGWKVLAANFFGTFFLQFRSLIIGRFYSAVDLAYYNRGSRFPELISNNVDGTISTVLFPVLSQYSDDLNKLKEMTRRSMRMSSFVILPLMFGMAVAAKPITILLLTKNWLPSVPFMQCLCVAFCFSTISNANMQALKASGRSDVLLKLEVLKKPVYLVFILSSIKISVLAVAVSMVLNNFIEMLIDILPNKRVIKYPYKEQFKDVFPAFLLAIIMVLFIYPIGFLHLNSIFEILLDALVGSIVYLSGAYLLKLQPLFYLLNYLKHLL